MSPFGAVYSLALSSKHFFRDAAADGNVADGSAGPAEDTASSSMMERAMAIGYSRFFLSEKTEEELKTLLSKHKPALGGSSSVLATRLLKQSLLSSLGRVLEQSKSGITLDSALALANLPEGSALIAGSTIVAACLGVELESDRYIDVDVFCSAKAAPTVRSWLVEDSSCMFVGFKDTYIDMVDDCLLYTIDTQIHHVERECL